MTHVKRIIAIASVGLLFLPAAGAFAQVSRLDKVQLIESLRKQGMNELALRLVETEQFKDPIIGRQIKAETLALEYQDKTAKFAENGDPATLKQATDAFDAGLAERRGLIQENPDNDQKPLWEINLVEQLVTTYLPDLQQNAAVFYDLGVPTQQQKQAFEATATEAYEMMADAEHKFFDLKGELGRNAARKKELEDTGQWGRMFDDYEKKRMPFFLATAAYDLALLPDTATYYQTLGKNKFVNAQTQKKTPAEERARLLSVAAEQIAPSAQDANDPNGIHAVSQLLLGQVLRRQGKYDDAITNLDAVVKAGIGGRDDLVAQLTEVYALAGKKNPAGADELLDKLNANAMVQGNLLLRVLKVDVEHQVKLARAKQAPADKQAAAIGEAYKPYLDLLNDDKLGDAKNKLKEFIYKRWETSVDPKQELGQLPAVVVMAIAEVALDDGRNLIDTAAAAGDEKAAQAQHDKGVAQLQRSIKINQDLLKRKELPSDVAAQAMMNLALATYFTNPADNDVLLKTGKTLLDLATRFPESKLSETAMRNAIEVGHQLYAMNPKPMGTEELYAATMKEALEKFPTLDAVDNERFYYAREYLLPAGKIDEAIEQFGKLPFGHPNYFPARQERLNALYDKYQKAPADKKEEARKALGDAAADLLKETDAAMPAAPPEMVGPIKSAAAAARLSSADVAIDSNKIDEALKLLDNFEADFAGEEGLIRLALGKRIIGLARVGQFDKAVDQAQMMMKVKEFRDDAAPVIDGVINDMEKLIDDYRSRAANELADRVKQDLNDKAKQAAQTVQKLAQLLMNWAMDPNKKPKPLNDQELIPFKLVLAKATRLGGDPDAAVKLLEPLSVQFPTEAAVINELAEAYFAQGMKTADKKTGEKILAEKAGPLYIKLIEGVPADKEGKVPPVVWNAWMRWFQICEKIGDPKNTDDIASRVEAFKLQDKNLGGEPYKSELIRLANKYSK